MSHKAIFEFPNEEARDSFIAWFADGGGEFNFFESEDFRAEDENRKPIIKFDYKQAFGSFSPDKIVSASE